MLNFSFTSLPLCKIKCLLESTCNVVKYWVALLAGACLIKDIHTLDALKFLCLVHITFHHDLLEFGR